MAVIEFVDGHKRMVSAWQGAHIWKILNDDIEANDREAKYCSRIKAVYLNRVSPETPKSYLERHRHLFPDTSPVSRNVVASAFPVTRKDLT
jgi:hypothetical protein